MKIFLKKTLFQENLKVENVCYFLTTHWLWVWWKGTYIFLSSDIIRQVFPIQVCHFHFIGNASYCFSLDAAVSFYTFSSESAKHNKHIPRSSQIHNILHLKVCLSQFLFPNTLCLYLSEETNEAPQPDSDMTWF